MMVIKRGRDRMIEGGRERMIEGENKMFEQIMMNR